MSEPTPLSAEELAGYRACHRKTTGTTADAEGNLHPECICGDYWPCWPSQLFATIDAQATEIAALRAVSSQQQQRAQLAEERVAALKGALEEDLCPWHRGGEGMRPYSWDEPCGTKAFLIVKPCERVRRVLAGKEAQGEQRLRENKLNTAPRKSGYITQKWDGLSRPEFHGRTEEAQGD